MEKPIVDRIRKQWETYDQGRITWTELINGVVDLASNPEFFNHLDLIPKEVKAELRERAKNAPAHPDEILVYAMGSYVNFDAEAHDATNRKARERAYWGARRLREYFFPNLPMPQFEAMKLAGVVEEAIEHSGRVVIFGDISRYLIRDYPVHLVTPDGSKIIASASETGFIRRDNDADSTDRLVRQYGRCGVMLGEDVRSPDFVPPGTEVWIDRSAAELPEPPRQSS